MREGGQYHYSLVTCTRQNNTSEFLHCIWLNLARVEAPSLHYGCTQEHHRLAQHTERRTRLNRTLAPKLNKLPKTLYSLWMSFADIKNEVGCLGSGCLQRRRAGDEKHGGVALLLSLSGIEPGMWSWNSKQASVNSKQASVNSWQVEFTKCVVLESMLKMLHWWYHVSELLFSK